MKISTQQLSSLLNLHCFATLCLETMPKPNLFEFQGELDILLCDDNCCF